MTDLAIDASKLYPNSPPPVAEDAPAVLPAPKPQQPAPQPKPLAAEQQQQQQQQPAENQVDDAPVLDEQQIAELQQQAFAEVAEQLGIDDPGLVATEVQRQLSTAQTQWEQQARADKLLSAGAGFDANLQVAKNVIAQHGDGELRQLLNSGLGNHPAMLRFALKVGRALAAKATPSPPRQQAPQRQQAQQPAREQALDDSEIAKKLYGRSRSPAPRAAVTANDDASVAAKLYPKSR